jgi:hypothetical protein
MRKGPEFGYYLRLELMRLIPKALAIQVMSLKKSLNGTTRNNQGAEIEETISSLVSSRTFMQS